MSDDSLPAGALWDRIVATTDQAMETGALVPIDTRSTLLWDGGFPFLIRVASSLARKDYARAQAQAQASPAHPGADPTNPFLPYEPRLFVADLSRTHVGLLNKFNVVAHHLLLVTRAFEPQEQLLTAPDFAALWRCLRELGGLGFYNGGEVAGASQPHKHLQWVPLPFTDAGPAVPLGSALEGVTAPERRSPALPFAHAVARLSFSELCEHPSPADLLRDTYHALLAHVGLGGAGTAAPGDRQTGPYNLLLTREWMLVVPRVQERFHGISLNGLAFAGSFFVRDEGALEVLREQGPLRALQAVTEGTTERM